MSATPLVMHLVASRPRRDGVAPGDVWSYNTGGAWLLGRVLGRATGMPIAQYLQTRLWSRFPTEHDGVWEALEPNRIDMGGHGFNATLRDWGRFGLFIERGGRLDDGTQLLPDGWLKEATTWTRARGSVTPQTPDGQYGFQWWYNPGEAIAADPDGVMAVARDSFWAEGIYGQVIAIAGPEDGSWNEMATFFAAAVHTLRPGA